jgi:hypothetical protein
MRAHLERIHFLTLMALRSIPSTCGHAGRRLSCGGFGEDKLYRAVLFASTEIRPHYSIP